MKKYLSKLLVGVSLLCVTQVAPAETLKMGFHQLKPHAYKDDVSGDVKGAAVAYVNELAAQMGYDVEWVGPLPVPRLLAYCQEGKLDGAVPIPKAPEWEQKVFWYPDFEIWNAKAAFLVKKDNPLDEIRSIDDVAGYDVGFLKGVSPSKFIKEHQEQFRIDSLAGGIWLEQNLTKLLAGRIDAIHELNTISLRFAIKDLGLEDQVKILTLPEAPQQIYAPFSQHSDKGKELLEKYNQAAQQLQLDYEDFVQKELDMVGR